MLFSLLQLRPFFSPIGQWVFASVLQFFVGCSFYQGAFSALRRGRLTMDTLVVLGTSAAYAYSLFSFFYAPSSPLYFDTNASVITLIVFGRFLESVLLWQANASVKELQSLQPETALVQEGEFFVEKQVSLIAVGEIVLVKPGDIVPVDGVLLKESAVVNEAILTGESAFIEKKRGDSVFTGTLNESSAFTVQVTSLEGETLLGKMIACANIASRSKAPEQKLVDTISAYFVPSVLLMSIVGAFWGAQVSGYHALENGVSVLIIACPCALGLATPMIVLVATFLAAKSGLLIKDIACLEKIARLDIIFFDKTGTLTEGKPRLSSLHLEEKGEIGALYQLASLSNHPLAKAFVEQGELRKDSHEAVESFFSDTGRGIEGILHGGHYLIGSKAYLEEKGARNIPLGDLTQTHVFFAKNGVYLGEATFVDAPRKEAKKLIGLLNRQGIQTAILSGDESSVVESMHTLLGTDACFFRLSPSEKAEHVKNAQKDGLKVAFVGDGVNDALALTAADVGFAVCFSSDIAMEYASVALLHPSILGIDTALRLGKRVKVKILQNLFLAFVYNALAVPLAAFGFFHPILAALLMACSSSSVILNALYFRWRGIKPHV